MDTNEQMNGIRQAFEQIADRLEGVDYSLSGPESDAPVGNAIDSVAKEIRDLGAARGNEFAPLEAIAVALGGEGIHNPIGTAIERNAEANNRIADALESIAIAISNKD